MKNKKRLENDEIYHNFRNATINFHNLLIKKGVNEIDTKGTIFSSLFVLFEEMRKAK
jgi:hypothetical protein